MIRGRVIPSRVVLGEHRKRKRKQANKLILMKSFSRTSKV
jgi:hypothetical protein